MIIMKLLAKTPEERYQTAAGVEHDLQRCLHAWETEHRIGEFPLGEYDTLDRLVIPEKLYGREREVEMLLAAFDRVVASGTPEMVLVSGYSGVGKSSVVNELHKALVPPRGLFASGKFDQYKRDIPYSTLAQGFQHLIRPILAKSDTELAGWRGALQEALSGRARGSRRAAPRAAGRSPRTRSCRRRLAPGRRSCAGRRGSGRRRPTAPPPESGVPARR
jgi:hypothetical protein